MESSRRAGDSVDEMARILRLVGDREVHHVVFELAEAPEERPWVQFTTDPGVFWGEVIAPPGASTRPLEALGWRAPMGQMPNWFQYFSPTRKRHYRDLAKHVAATFAALGADGSVIANVDSSSPADGHTFMPPDRPEEESDDDLLEMAETILGHLSPSVYDTHLEVTMGPKHHRVRIAISATRGTLTCAALHLPAVEPEVAAAALTINNGLEQVAYTYAIRALQGHGDSLVLQSKITVMPGHRHPHIVGLLLFNTLEPLVAAHRALRDVVG